MKAVRLLTVCAAAAALVACDARSTPSTKAADESARPQTLADDERILERARLLADENDLAGAHAALDALPPSSDLVADPRVTAIEDAWADRLLAQARDDASDDRGKRLLEQVAAAPRVSTPQKQRAIEQIVELDRPELTPPVLGGAGLLPSAVAGGGNVGSASAVVRSLSPALRRCYNQGLATDPTAAGTIRMTLTLGASGEVVSATSKSTGKLPAKVVTCVEDVARAARFTPPVGGAATIVLPVTFVSQ